MSMEHKVPPGLVITPPRSSPTKNNTSLKSVTTEKKENRLGLLLTVKAGQRTLLSLYWVSSKCSNTENNSPSKALGSMKLAFFDFPSF
jgi:hypothetical protein